MVDALDLSSSVFGREGSNPSSGTGEWRNGDAGGPKPPLVVKVYDLSDGLG